MRTLMLAFAGLAAAAGSAAAAQPTASAAPAPPPTPPRVFLAAGYTQPDITPGYCKMIDASQVQCTLPAMTAGRYFVGVAGTSTATAAGAAQQIVIQAGEQRCTSTRAPDAKAPWAVGAKRTLYSACIFTVITDTPLVITGVYLDEKATKDPKGPILSVSRQPWLGVISALPVRVPQQ
jgi:hypothetical protein